MPDPTGRRPDRNLALELVRVTEYGALAAARWVGGKSGVYEFSEVLDEMLGGALENGG